MQDEHIRNSVDVIGEVKLHKGASNIIFDQGLLYHVKNSLNESCRYFVSSQMQPVIHSLLEVPKKA
jgi:hypothetical protein